jgi:Na+/proline symporter
MSSDIAGEQILNTAPIINPEAVTPVPENEPKKKSTIQWGWIILGILVLVLLIYLFYLIFKRNSAKKLNTTSSYGYRPPY